ncbi:MAG: TetR/AcrR family transcriptional regulator [Williamsia herbipolensis]|uniref:Transcriptional regulator, TetR family n=1 Tax=Williamsia serinedens TaxID=391736 RepID=A0ABT1GZ12_9NOCA|nr:TetR/AcrR family transcriptional regulator [Williamsia serinedens]MBE7161052.1 TetR/AcrR family transcriptional regulator [Williamsia herbipolensis]MCP2159625.1 transcriptional regulator, TetR family [Williamsia serinedens]
MPGGTKRLPRAVREQQMLDAAVKVFAEKGFRETSMDAIAAAADISKPMLYLYHGSKDELFAACLNREGARFIDAMTIGFDPRLRQRDQARTVIYEFLRFVDANRDSWRVLYRVATGQAAFAGLIAASRARLIEMIADLLRRGTTVERATDREFELMAVALVGAGEAVADRISEGDIDLDTAADIMVQMGWHGLAGGKRIDEHAFD